MTSKKELKLALGVAIVLLVVGVACFAAFSAKTPDEPLRVVFGGAAGNVMFNHQTHYSDDGYSMECHEAEDHEDLELATVKGVNVYDAESCLDCHDEMEEMTPSKRTDSFHGQCIGCHAEMEAGPQECAECHLK